MKEGEEREREKKEKAATNTSDCGNDEEEVNFTGYKANITRRHLRYTLPRRHKSRTMGQRTSLLADSSLLFPSTGIYCVQNPVEARIMTI